MSWWNKSDDEEKDSLKKENDGLQCDLEREREAKDQLRDAAKHYTESQADQIKDLEDDVGYVEGQLDAWENPAHPGNGEGTSDPSTWSPWNKRK